MPAAEMHMFICVHFFATRKLQLSDQRAESKKNAYTIYTLNIYFLYSKSAYTIYTPENTFPAGSSHSSGPITTLPSIKPAGSRQKQTKQLLFHSYILQAYTTRQSQTTTTQPLQHSKKKYTLIQPQVYTHFFAHFSRFPQNGRQKIYLLQEKNRRKKDKKGIKRY